MNVTWVTRSFLDYRIPVFKELDALCGHHLTLIYNGAVVPERVREKAAHALSERSVALLGEIATGSQGNITSGMANSGLRIPYQPGLCKRIQETQPDVMISDGFFQWTYAPLVLRFMKRIPHVMCYERTCHTERNAGRLRTLYRRQVMRYIDAIDANGSLTGEYLSCMGYDMSRVTYGHMAADTGGVISAVSKVPAADLLALREKWGCHGLVFLYVGQIIPRKGVKELLDAWERAGLSNAHLIIVGQGAQRAKLEAREIPGVSFIGAVDYDSLAPYYAMADCFIIPTLEDNWSLVVPEAMACGLPIMCSCYNGCHPELVRPENGWVFNPLDVEGTARQLAEVVSQSSRYREMGAASREIVAHYSPHHAAQSIYDACKIAINHVNR